MILRDQIITVISSIFVGISFCGFCENHSFKDSKFVTNNPINTTYPMLLEIALK